MLCHYLVVCLSGPCVVQIVQNCDYPLFKTLCCANVLNSDAYSEVMFYYPLFKTLCCADVLNSDAYSDVMFYGLFS